MRVTDHSRIKIAKRLGLACIGLLAIFSPAGAAETVNGLITGTYSKSPDVQTSRPTLTLTIQDAVKLALDRNYTVLYDRERITEEGQAHSYAMSLFLPTLSGVGSAMKDKATVNSGNAPFGGSPYNLYNVSATLTQPIWAGGALTNGLDATKNEMQSRKLQLKMGERDLTVQVMEAFYTVMLNQELVNVLKYTLEMEKGSLVTTERYYRIGRAQLLDVLQVKTQVALLYPQISTAENAMKASAAQLLTYLHEDSTGILDLKGSLEYIEPKEIAKLLPNREPMPEILQGEALIAEFGNTEAVTLATNNPTFQFIAQYGKTSNTQSTLLDDYANNWSAGFQLTIPIFSGFSSVHQRQVLDAQKNELEINQVGLIDTLTYNQVQTERNLDTAESVLKTSKDAEEMAVASLKEAERGYRLQTIIYTQLLTSQAGYLTAATNDLQARYSYIDSVAKYFVSAGIPIADLIKIL